MRDKLINEVISHILQKDLTVMVRENVLIEVKRANPPCTWHWDIDTLSLGSIKNAIAFIDHALSRK